jgi:hypothetical protein
VGDRQPNLAVLLAELGYEGDEGSFHDLIVDTLAEAYRAWSIDELLIHPHDAIEYCRIVCRRARVDLPEPLVLRTLLNIRKHKGWRQRHPEIPEDEPPAAA